MWKQMWRKLAVFNLENTRRLGLNMGGALIKFSHPSSHKNLSLMSLNKQFFISWRETPATPGIDQTIIPTNPQ